MSWPRWQSTEPSDAFIIRSRQIALSRYICKVNCLLHLEHLTNIVSLPNYAVSHIGLPIAAAPTPASSNQDTSPTWRMFLTMPGH